MARAPRVRVGASRPSGGRPSSQPAPSYAPTYTSYTPARADAVGQDVGSYAYQSSQQIKAYNRRIAGGSDE